MKIRSGFIVFVLFFFVTPAFSHPISIGSDTTKTKKLKFVVGSNEARLNMPLSINPDFYCLRMGRGGAKWNNVIGNTIGLVNYENRKIKIAFTISGFIALHDFDRYQFMSWQLWRGNLGSSVFLDSPDLDKFLGKNGRLVVELGWYHESQHVTDVVGYLYRFMDPRYVNVYSFRNADIRSFEYSVAGLCYDWQTPNKNWRLFVNPRYRYFPSSLLLNERQLIDAYSLEAGVHRKINNSIHFYIQGFYERINNNFVSKKFYYLGNWDKEPLVYQNLETGFTFQNREKRQFNIFLNYSKSNGRGLDFINVYEEYGMGFRIIL